MIMKSGEINAASVACYIASLERENEWLRDRNMEMIDISAVRGIPVGISDDLVKRRIGDRRTVRDYVNKRMFTVHPRSTDGKMFLDLFDVLTAPDKSVLRKQARCINDGVKFDKTNTRIMKARVELDEQTGKVVIITEQGTEHSFTTLSRAVRWCRANNVRAELF